MVEIPFEAVCQYQVTPPGTVPALVKVTPGGLHCGESLVGALGVAGKEFTVNDVALVAVPPGVVTVTGPVVPVPTVTVMEVPVFEFMVAMVPPILTVAPLKFVPVIISELPVQPWVALSDVMVGFTGTSTCME